MGPTSDLGPVDPQLQFPDGRLMSAKAVIAAVEAAERAVQERPDSFPIHASLLANVDAILLQMARSAMDRSSEQVREALRSNPERLRRAIALEAPLSSGKSTTVPAQAGPKRGAAEPAP